MNWTEITVNVPLEYTDTAAAIANMTVPYGIYIEDYSDLEQEAEEIAHIDLIDEELVKKDRTKSVIHIYISECDNAEESLAFLKERLAAEKIPFEVGAVGVNDNDWKEKILSRYRNRRKACYSAELGKLRKCKRQKNSAHRPRRRIRHGHARHNIALPCNA